MRGRSEKSLAIHDLDDVGVIDLAVCLAGDDLEQVAIRPDGGQGAAAARRRSVPLESRRYSTRSILMWNRSGWTWSVSISVMRTSWC